MCRSLVTALDFTEGTFRLATVPNERLSHFLLVLIPPILLFIAFEVAYELIDKLRLVVIFVSVFVDLCMFTDLNKELLVFLGRRPFLAALRHYFSGDLNVHCACIINGQFFTSEVIDLSWLDREALGAATIV